MRFKTLLFFVLLFVFVSFSAGTATVNAQGVIVPGPCQRCPRPPREIPPVSLPRSLPIKSIKIDTKILSQVATTHLEQVFRNDTGATLEGTYLFPIPESASIVEFAIWDGDRRLVGEVRSREEARRIYDEIVRRQRDPGLLEYAGKNLFQASIFPIPPYSDKKLELTYTQVLRAESGTVAFRYPLGVGHQLAEIGSVAGRVELQTKDPVRIPARVGTRHGTRVVETRVRVDRLRLSLYRRCRGRQGRRGVAAPRGARYRRNLPG